MGATTTDVSTPTGLAAWLAANGNVVFFFAQLAFWLVLAAAAVWATTIFNRYVSFKIDEAGPSVKAKATEDDAIDVDEFVE